jgi:hypothetical protein
MWELALILVVALIVLGPRQLTETARVVGKLYRELQRMTSDLRSNIDLDLSSPSSSYSPPPPVYRPPAPEPLEPGGKKTGPDFYADLLEKSEEEERKELAESQNPSSENLQQNPERTDKPKEEKKA